MWKKLGDFLLKAFGQIFIVVVSILIISYIFSLYSDFKESKKRENAQEQAIYSVKPLWEKTEYTCRVADNFSKQHDYKVMIYYDSMSVGKTYTPYRVSVSDTISKVENPAMMYINKSNIQFLILDNEAELTKNIFFNFNNGTCKISTVFNDGDGIIYDNEISTFKGKIIDNE